jgi:diadenylate cyclase
VDEIVEAAKIMSSRRTGALICIERDVSLDDLANTGILIDGFVTRQLLMNIFVNRTPLPDGAIIIRHNRVVAATCILPLTTSEIDHELGTRHRAALGASEVSDALVVVVSEETGAVSVAAAGELNRHLGDGQLREILFTGRKENKRRLIPWKNRKISPSK